MRGIVARYGSRTGITFFVMALRLGGVRLAYLFLYFVVPYYILLRPAIYRSMRPYLRRRFPGRGRLTLFCCAWKLVQEFSRMMIDQAAAAMTDREYFAVDVLQEEKLRSILTAEGGVVLVTTHVGNWKALIPRLPTSGKVINLLFHRDPTAPTSGPWGVPEELGRAKLIDPTGPFGGLVEAATALERGELVAIMGDRHWGGRTTVGAFLGDSVYVPRAPYRLGRVTGARIVAVLTAKVAPRRYKLDFCEVARPGDSGSDSKCDAELAQVYLDFVERFLQQHPFSWFNFYDLWQGQEVPAVPPSGERPRRPDGMPSEDDRTDDVGPESPTGGPLETSGRLA